RWGAPPFGRYVKLTVGLADPAAAEAEAEAMAERLRSRAAELAVNVAVIGPAPAYIARRAERWRWNVVLRGPDPVALLGVGLAAPQLGEPLRCCVIEVEGQVHELVNPEIARAVGDDRDLEGCLSIPGYVAYITRRERVWVVAQNRFGRKVRVSGTGLLGR